jgi:hypothetical protein
MDIFPEHFMFELTEDDFVNLRLQIVTSSWRGLRYPPMAFSEQGIAMLSSVLYSDQAILVNIRIIRFFVKMRKLLLTHKDIITKLKEMEQIISGHDESIILILEYLRLLKQAKQQHEDQINRKKIGFRQDD